VGQRVDRDPVAGFARGAAKELPGSFRLAIQRAVKEAEGEPAMLQLRLTEEAVGEEEQRRRAFLSGRLAEAPRHGRQQGPANAKKRPDAGRHSLLAGEIVGVGQLGQAAADRRCERVGIVRQLGKGAAQRFRRAPALGHQRNCTGGGGARRRGRRCRDHRRAAEASTSSRRKP
jgi:hypothetical protein